MQNDYKTILATCLRLKDVVAENVLRLTSSTLLSYQSLQPFVRHTMKPLLQEVDNLIKVLPNELETQKQFIVDDCRRCTAESNIDWLLGFGSLLRDLDNLSVIVDLQNSTHQRSVSEKRIICKKMFISHSSKDKTIVDSFVTLLTRGAGLSQDDIFCTSIDGMKIMNGEDIRKHIQENVNGADFAILLASNNYKESEVCLNEMGAIWAIDKKVKTYVFPDLQEESVGWLINDKAAEKLNDETALASLYEELQRFYELPLSLTRWTAQAKAFCGHFG